MPSTVEILILAQDAASGVFGKIGQTIGGMGVAIAGVAVNAIGKLGDFLGDSVVKATEAQQAETQLDAVLKSTSASFGDAAAKAVFHATSVGTAAASVDTGGKTLKAYNAELAKAPEKLQIATARLHDMEAAYAKAKTHTESATLSLTHQREAVANLTDMIAKGAAGVAATANVQGYWEQVPGKVQITKDEVLKLSEALGKVTRNSEDEILTGQNMLLTFCLQEEAQALAKGRGWVSHKELNTGDHILAYDPADDSIRWEPVESMHRFDVDDDLIRWQSRQIDVMTTPQHKWWTTANTSAGSGSRPSGHKQPYRFRTTEEISGHQISVMIGGGQPACFRKEPVLDDDLVELLGWVITEGHFVTQTPNHTGVSFCQSQTANPENVERIRQMASRFVEAGWIINETQRQLAYNYSIMSVWGFAGELGQCVRELLPNKKLTVSLLEQLTRKQAEGLLDVLIAADGSTDKSGARQYIQKDTGQLDVVAILCAMLGIRTSLLSARPDSIYLCKTNNAFGHQLNAHAEHYKGIVWCPHLRTGIFLARCNGRTFWTGNTNIGKDTFPGATKAMLDMATAMASGAKPSAESLKNTAIQLGKALNDPVKDATALQRVGVTLTESQKEMIKSFVASGDVAKAQGVILKELETEFGGSAEAAGRSAAGQADILGHSFEKMQEKVGGVLLDLQSKLLVTFGPFIVQALQTFTDMLSDPSVGIAIQNIGVFIKGIGDSISMLVADLSAGDITSAIGNFTGNMLQAFGMSEQQALGFADAVGSIVGAIKDILPRVQAAVQTVITAFTTGDFTPVLTMVQGWGAAFLDWIKPVVDGIPDKLRELGTKVGDWITAEVPRLKGLLADWAGTFLGWVDTLGIGEKLNAIWFDISNWISLQGVKLRLKLDEWVQAFGFWILTLIQDMPAKLAALGESIGQWVGTEGKRHADRVAKEWLPAFTKWVGDVGKWLTSPQGLKTIGDFIYQWTIGIPLQLAGAFTIFGVNFVNGLIDGIGGQLQQLRDFLFRVVRDIVIGAAGILGIKIPDNVFNAMPTGLENFAPAHGASGSNGAASNAQDAPSGSDAATVHVYLDSSMLGTAMGQVVYTSSRGTY